MIVPLNNGIATSILDYDAREFIRVAGIKDDTQVRAINKLCKDLKREGFWNSLYRAFPFVGATSSMLYCLKTRLTLTQDITPNSITYSNTGVQFGFTSSLFIPTTFLQNTEIYYGGHIAIYNRTSTNLNYTQRHGMVGNGGLQRFTGTFLEFGTASGGIGRMNGSFYNGSVYNVPGNPYNSPNPDGFNGNPRFNTFTYSGNNTGLFIYSNTNIETGTASLTTPFTFYMSKNETILGITSSPRNFAGQSNAVRLGNFSYIGSSISNQSQQEICWWSIGGGLADGSNGGPILLSQQPIFYQIIQEFQTTLGRQV